MIEEKPWYLSKTIWGALIAIAASALNAGGIEFGSADQAQLAEALVQLAGAGGAVLAVYGRLMARKVIG